MSTIRIPACAGFFLASLCFAGALLAQDFAMNPTSATANPGGSASMDVDYTTDGTVTQAQFDISGFTATQFSSIGMSAPDANTGGALTDCIAAGVPINSTHTVNCSIPAPGALRVVISTAGTTVLATTPSVVRLTFSIASGATVPSTENLVFTGVVLSNAAAMSVPAGTLTNGVLSLSATAQPALGLTPTSLAFGNQVNMTSSAMMTVTATNIGDPGTTLSVTGVAISGANGADFAIPTDTCTGAMLAHNASCSVGVAFAPASSGAKLASLNVSSPSGSRSATLSGAGVAGVAGQPVAGGDPAIGSTITLGPARQGNTANQTILISNTGFPGTTLTLSACTLSPAMGFGTLSTTGLGNIVAGGVAGTIGLSCTAGPSTFSATLSCSASGMDSNGGVASVPSPLTWAVQCATRPRSIPALNTIGLAMMMLLLGFLGLSVVRPRR